MVAGGERGGYDRMKRRRDETFYPPTETNIGEGGCGKEGIFTLGAWRTVAKTAEGKLKRDHESRALSIGEKKTVIWPLPGGI